MRSNRELWVALMAIVVITLLYGFMVVIWVEFQPRVSFSVIPSASWGSCSC